MWPYNTQLPFEVDEVLHTVHLTRPRNKEMFDAGTYLRTYNAKVKLNILLEAKTTLDPLKARGQISRALQRQDASAKVGFIVFDVTFDQFNESFDLS